MKILIANPGSTSYKCKLYETSDMSVLFQATVERIGDDEGIYSYSLGDEEQKSEVLKIGDYFKAVDRSDINPDNNAPANPKIVLPPIRKPASTIE